jgi:PilZ domain-containing protein
MSLRAQLDTEPDKGERRSSRRRKLRLETEGASASSSQTQVIIHDLSEEGLLVESPIPLVTGELLEVVVPEAGTAQAEVTWDGGRFYGCKFREPISTAAVSAALLRSPTSKSERNAEVVEKALIELEALSFAIKRVTKAVDQAIDRLNKKKD